MNKPADDNLLMAVKKYRKFDNSAYLEPLKKVFCKIPFSSYHIYDRGLVSNCCFSWLPTHIGNINETPLLQMIENDLSKQVKNSMLNGSFSFCNPDTCPALNEYVYSNKLTESTPLNPIESYKSDNKKLVIYLDYDRSCNLYCESCRNERVLYTVESAPEQLRQTHENAVMQINELIKAGYDITLSMCGSGDVFVSPFYWKFLKEMQEDYPVKLELITNGLLLTEDRLAYPFAQKINQLQISIDAASEKTYAKVRRGGNLNVLHKNIKALDRWINEGKLKNLKKIGLIFVVQQDNYNEVADFAEWALSFKSVIRVWYNLIADWGHLTHQKFKPKAIWRPEHPEHQDFLNELKHPILKDQRVYLGNLSKFLN